jgi:cystathionine beta-lyase/cystathionine gamma-synthase
MKEDKISKLTQSVHAGSHGDLQFKGLVTPVFPSSAYDYEEGSPTLYPRYFNTPNQRSVVEKLCALESAETGLVFSSGMAAILTTLFAFLKKGDHAIFQKGLYGGTFDAVVKEFPRFGIEYSFVDGSRPDMFEKEVRTNTKVIYIESPSNPTLMITDISAIADIARRNGLITVIDNTFASPVNQNPIPMGIDVVVHSGTKYIGGHSDICCGAALGRTELIKSIYDSSLHFGGSLDAHTAWLVERSLKTLVLRVRQQNKNALAIAEFLLTHDRVGRVYYPGLKSHPGHEIAKSQMTGGFGGMLSFEVKIDAERFITRLSLIRKAVSLGGVESTITSPAKTSHVKMTEQERAQIGVTDHLLRLSVGIEEATDLIDDITNALEN